MTSNRMAPTFASHLLCLGLPILVLFYALKDEWSEGPQFVLIFVSVYITVVYAAVGGFERSRVTLPKWRQFLFFALGGIGLAIILQFAWMAIQALLAKVLSAPELESFPPFFE